MRPEQSREQWVAIGAPAHGSQQRSRGCCRTERGEQVVQVDLVEPFELELGTSLLLAKAGEGASSHNAAGTRSDRELREQPHRQTFGLVHGRRGQVGEKGGAGVVQRVGVVDREQDRT